MSRQYFRLYFGKTERPTGFEQLITGLPHLQLVQASSINPILLHMSTVATIPTNINALDLIALGKYEKYDPEDFIRIMISTENTVKGTGVIRQRGIVSYEEVSSVVSYRVRPEDISPTSLRRATQRFSQLQIFLELSLSGGAAGVIPREATLRKDLKEAQNESIVLFSQSSVIFSKRSKARIRGWNNENWQQKIRRYI